MKDLSIPRVITLIGLVVTIIGLVFVIISLIGVIIEWQTAKTNERIITGLETTKLSANLEPNWSDSTPEDETVDAQGEPVTDPRELEDLAEQGDARAQFNLGLMYHRGRGVRRDHEKAVKWYTAAAEQGLAEAQYTLGLIYNVGIGIVVPQDYEIALQWFKLAAEQGHAGAQTNLGMMYEKGTGVRQNNVYAYMWFSIATLSGDKGVYEKRDIIAEQMTSDQLEKAQNLALECYQKEYKECLMGSH